jgi:hypothetical protein
MLGAMDAAAFERKVAEARNSAARVFSRAVREAEIVQERAERRMRTALGVPARRCEHLRRLRRTRRAGARASPRQPSARGQSQP